MAQLDPPDEEFARVIPRWNELCAFHKAAIKLEFAILIGRLEVIRAAVNGDFGFAAAMQSGVERFQRLLKGGLATERLELNGDSVDSQVDPLE